MNGTLVARIGRTTHQGKQMPDDLLRMVIERGIERGLSRWKVYDTCRKAGYGLGMTRLSREWDELTGNPVGEDTGQPDPEETHPPYMDTETSSVGLTKIISIFPDGRITVELRA